MTQIKSNMEEIHKQARSLMAKGEYKLAKVLLLRNLTEINSHPKTLSYLALCSFNLEDYDASIEFAKRALTSVPHADGTRLILAKALAHSGRIKAATRHLEQLIRSERVGSDACLELGLIKRYLGLLIESKKFLELAVQKDPDNTEAADQLYLANNP